MSGASTGAAARDVPQAPQLGSSPSSGRVRKLGTRAGAALAPLLAAVALASAATALPSTVREAVDVARADREGWERPELYPGDIGMPATIVEAAEREMPEDALYAVAIGDQLPVVAGGVGIVQALNYFLLPRRSAGEVWRADWVIAWGESSETLGVPIAREIGLAPHVNLVEVRR